jgi:glycosyltransferase involved in cell wall biosynthesis
MKPRRSVIIYRDTLLGPYETFIKQQAESLRTFSPVYVGLRRASGLSLPESQVRILCGSGVFGKLQRGRFKMLGSSVRQQRAIARESPALIHAHFGQDGCDVIQLARALCIPLLVTFHGWDVTEGDDRLPRRYVRRRDLLGAYAARLICVSEFVRNRALAKGFPAAKAVVHYTGIDTEFFRADPTVGRCPIVLFVGRLIPNKGCAYLIRALAAVQKVRPGVRLVVIGDGPLRKELEAHASAVLAEYEFLGVQSPAIVREWMNRSAVFCVPSVTIDRGVSEGFGMVFAEAQAMGLPVVSFVTGGIPEAVAHDQSGLLVPERDWEGLAMKLSILLGNQALWQQFSEAGQARVARLFDSQKQAVSLEKIYEDVLTESG